MSIPIKAHDRFFRSSMHNTVIARQFFNYHLPTKLIQQIDFSAMKLENSDYIDEELRESVSDLVFSCPYVNKNCGEAKIILFVEHQSSPDKFMAFRVFRYLFNMLNNHLKERNESDSKLGLPAVYALVFFIPDILSSTLRASRAVKNHSR